MKKSLLYSFLMGAMMLLVTNAWAGTYTVKFLNNYSWEHVCAWVWDENNNNLYDEWPGQEMTPDGTGRYVLTFTWNLVPKYILFNDRGNGNQTGDFEFVNNGIYDANGLVEVEADLTGIATFNLGASPGVSTPEGFFTHDLDGNWNFNAKFCDAEFDGIQFSKGLKMENTTKIFFTTTTISTVTIVQSTWNANTIKLDGMELAVEDAVEGIGCRIYTMEVPAGNHTIGRGSGESGLFYIKVEGDNNYDTIIPDGTYYVMSAGYGTLINAEGNLDATGTPITFKYDNVKNAYTIEGVDFCNGKQWTVADAIEGLSGFYTISNADGFLSVSATMTLEQISDGTSDAAVWILLKKGYWEDIVNSTYTVAGTKNLTGTASDWDIVDANKMTLNDMTGLFEKKFKRITIDSENQPEFKVVQTNMNGENYWYPNGNWVITTSYVGGEGLYDITITFDPSDFKEIGVIAEKRIVFPDDAIVFDFEAAAEAGENPENFNGTVDNGHAFYGWEKFDKTDSKRQDYKGYVWTEGSLLPQVCQVWRRSDRINGNVKGDGLYCPSDKEMAIDGLEPGSKVIIVYDATNAAEGDKEMIWAVGDGTSEGGPGTPRATATINGIEAVSGETTIPSGAEIAVKSVTPAENGSGYIVVKVKKGMTIKQIAIVKIEKDPQIYTEFDEATGTLTYYYDSQMASRTGITELYDPVDNPDAVRFTGYYKKVTKAVIDPSMKNAPLTSMYSMFFGGINNETFAFQDLWKMTEIKGMENLNTANVTRMDLMFEGCNALKTIDVNSFDISKVTKMDFMFGDCYELTTIYCSKDWSSTSASSDNMFGTCRKLVGGNGTAFDSNVTNATYARPDGGTASPGYFTERLTPQGDVNNDGTVDIADVVAVLNAMAGGTAQGNADVNNDTAIDIADVVAVLSIMAGK